VVDQTNSRESWAEDIASFDGVVVTGCGPFPIVGSVSSHLRSADDRSGNALHTWEDHGSVQIHPDGDEHLHTLAAPTAGERSVWVLRASYNLDPGNPNLSLEGGTDDAADDQWMQPKHMIILERRYDHRPREFSVPWGLFFRSRLDKQAVMSSAITYYHRHMQKSDQAWKEPPNFFNPFWRATLIAPDVDERKLSSRRASRESDLEAALGSSNPEFLQAWHSLESAGFKGVQ
jgi:hypothetical protein